MGEGIRLVNSILLETFHFIPIMAKYWLRYSNLGVVGRDPEGYGCWDLVMKIVIVNGYGSTKYETLPKLL